MRSLILFLILFIPSMALSADWPSRVEEIHLSNGMKFLLYPHGEAPIFSAYIRFRAGGIDEKPGETGLAHFLEHMAFKGTKTIGAKDKEELAKLVLENGGIDYNATTSQDMTSYFVSLPSEKFSFWADLESKRIFEPVFRDFDEEKKVVLEERRMRVDNDPDGELYEVFLQKAFGKSPYGSPTIGYPQDLERLTVDDLKSFWKRHYFPANAVGVIVGRFDQAEAKGILEKTFGKIVSKQVRLRRTVEGEAPPALLGEGATRAPRKARRVVLKRSARPRILIGYPKPALPHRDDYLFDLFNEIVGEGRSSRFYRSLVLEKKIAAQVSTTNGVPGSRLPNLFMIEAIPLEGHSPEKLIQAIDEEIAKIQQGGVSDRELTRAKNRLAVNLLWELKSNDGLASLLSYFEIAAGDWRYGADYLDRISAFHREDLQDLANHYLQKTHRTIAILAP